MGGAYLVPIPHESDDDLPKEDSISYSMIFDRDALHFAPSQTIRNQTAVMLDNGGILIWDVKKEKYDQYTEF